MRRPRVLIEGDYFVYALFRPDNGAVFYIGGASREKRLRERGTRGRGKMIRALERAGYTEIPSIVIRAGLTRLAAQELESAFIQAIGCMPDGPLVNKFRIGVIIDEEGRRNMSLAAKARDRSGDDEMRRRARMGDLDVRVRMSDSARKRERTVEFETRRLAAAHSPEARKKRGVSQARRGWITNGIEEVRALKTDPIPNGWRRGRLSGVASEATRERMRASRLRYIKESV